MEYVFAGFMLLLCIICLILMVRNQDGSYLMIGVTGLFSIGYYVLPVFFKSFSGLDRLNDEDVSVAIAMCFLFFFFLITGNYAATRYFRVKRFTGIKLAFFDGFFVRNRIYVFSIGFFIWITYFFNAEVTSYSADDFEAFFHERSPLDGLLAALSGFALSAMAVSLVLCIIHRQQKAAIWMTIIYAGCVVLLLSSGQRLAVISPIFTFVAALVLFGKQWDGIKIIIIGIMILIIISPFMVFVREFRGASGRDKILTATTAYSAGDDNVILKYFSSIMERADLIDVMTYLKKYIDASGYASGDYYPSIIYSFVPKFVMPNKPYPLSDTGTIRGEISVIAWSIYRGNTTGSLTAFGAISAYREGGWLWVPVNGFLTGISFSLIFAVLGRGGVVARWLFSVIFVTACIKNVPPSFFYLWVFMASSVNTLIVLVIFHKLLSSIVPKTQAASLYQRQYRE
jgi:hypothetical protein